MPSNWETVGGAVDSRLALLDQLRNTERRAAISRVASVIAHLIGTPLHVIAGRAALIRSNPDSAVENSRRIEEQVERLALRIRNLIGYLTSPEPEAEPRPVPELVTEALSLYEPIAAHSQIELKCAGQPPEGTVEGNAAMVVLTSLFSLAVRVAPQKGTVTLSFQEPSAGTIIFVLAVPGFPVPIAPIDRLDPPESVERTRAEHLQVLSVCHAIARRGGGRLEVVAQGSLTEIRFECPYGTA
ncbi:MAG TPA: HAMP domain-containing sensor histidine kinase [Polyangiaceae bacterium]|nr:HAMP domain-containing sensor histidine kinase [Polyangiaceae bacterium]